jgi:pentatricopeptide repeat domain-containing protein 1
LGEQDELRSLCDVFTYTTMISQCGSHHQLRRALELVAEMRSRVIGLNVHTYSALLNVCLKANELDLAQDIYAQMLSEGCTPNLVTYNTLVDIYGKLGRWADAVAVLDLLQQQVCRKEGEGGCAE